MFRKFPRRYNYLLSLSSSYNPFYKSIEIKQDNLQFYNLNDQVSLATDFVYNYFSRDVVASVGYDYILRQVNFWIVMELKNKQ